MKFAFVEQSLFNTQIIYKLYFYCLEQWICRLINLFSFSSHLSFLTTNQICILGYIRFWKIFLEEQLSSVMSTCEQLCEHHQLPQKSFVPWCKMITSGEQSIKKTWIWWDIVFTPDIVFAETENLERLLYLYPSMSLTIDSPKIKVSIFFSLVFLSKILLILSAFIFSIYKIFFEASTLTLLL